MSPRTTLEGSFTTPTKARHDAEMAFPDRTLLRLGLPGGARRLHGRVGADQRTENGQCGSTGRRTSCRTTPSRQATGQAAPGQVGGGCRSPPTRRDEGNPGTTPTTSAHELPQHPRGSTQTQPRTTTPTNSSTPTTGTHELPPYGTQTQPSITTPVKQLDTNSGAHEQPPHHPAPPGHSLRPLHRLTAGPRRPVLTNYRRAPGWHPDTAVDRRAG